MKGIILLVNYSGVSSCNEFYDRRQIRSSTLFAICCFIVKMQLRMKTKSLPPISVRKSLDNVKSDSFNATAFYAQTKHKTNFSNYYDDLSKLSAKAESLKQENELLKQELFNIATTTDNPTGYHKIKKQILAFTAKTFIREKELSSIQKAISSAKRETEPTLVSSFLPKDNTLLGFDAVSESLLIANPQKTFFTSEELESQNKELKRLIKIMNDKMQQYRKRLAIYETCQIENKVSLQMDSLKRGEQPPLLAEAAPAEVVEQREKIKILRKELKSLVSKRLKVDQANTFTEEDSFQQLTPRPPKSPHSPSRSPRSPKSPRNYQNIAPRSRRQKKIEYKIEVEEDLDSILAKLEKFKTNNTETKTNDLDYVTTENKTFPQGRYEIQNKKEEKEEEIQNKDEEKEKEIQINGEEKEKEIQNKNEEKEDTIQNKGEQKEKEIQNKDEEKEEEIQNKDEEKEVEEKEDKIQNKDEHKEDKIQNKDEEKENQNPVDELLASDEESESVKMKEENTNPSKSLLETNDPTELPECLEDELLPISPRSPNEDSIQDIEHTETTPETKKKKYHEFWRND